jgi:protein-S-isoprenylcysteine O-methyltransferase Ste14
MPMTQYQRIFGTGPRGLAISFATLFFTYAAADRYGPLTIHGSEMGGYIVLGLSVIATLAIAVWSVRSLPPSDRGKALVTSGAFQYFRHPLYASFLTFFDFGLAIYFDDWIFIAWAIIQHPVWHLNMLGEERLMRSEFGEDYDVYCKRTGRFVPRLFQRHSPG